MLLHLAVHLNASERGIEDRAEALRHAVSDSASLVDELGSIIEASKPNAEFLKMQEEQRKRQERQARKRADEKEA